jgi:opacity protein-like surface antigen
MHVDRSRHGLGRTLPVLGVAFLLAACWSTAGADAAVNTSQPKLAGTWSGTYSGAYSGTFTVHWKQAGSRLTGSIKLSSPSGTYRITGSVRGSTIKFGAVGAGATYTGSVSGRSMSGRYKSGPRGGAWSAHEIR